MTASPNPLKVIDPKHLRLDPGPFMLAIYPLTVKWYPVVIFCRLSGEMMVNDHKMHAAIKTLVVDDESIARQVLREELELIPEIQIIGEAANGKEALHNILNLQPDLVLLDLQMPDMGGFPAHRHSHKPS